MTVEAFLCDAVRTPIGRYAGSLAAVRADDLAAVPLAALKARHAGLDWHDHVKFDPRLLRPAEVELLIGDYSKAKKQLGWEPRTRMPALARLMIDADLAAAGPSV